jgi:hypothetical protein
MGEHLPLPDLKTPTDSPDILPLIMKAQLFTSELPTDNKQAAGITDKRGFGARWLFSPRHVDNLIKQGLPHLKIGRRRVRIMTDEADKWMIEKFGTQRRGPSRALPVRPEREAA